MRGILDFAKTTAIGGAVFLLPLILIGAVLVQAYEIMEELAQPISQVIPVDGAGGVALVTVTTILLLVALCFLVGLFARTTLARKFRARAEAKIFAGVPIYAFVKSMLTSSLPEQGEEGLKAVLVRFDDYEQIAFEVERLDDGRVTVFLPNAPNPWTGSLRLVEAERVSALPEGMRAAIIAIQQLGVGSRSLVGGAPDAAGGRS